MYIEELPIVMIRALLFTIVIEVFVSFLVGVRDKKDFLNIILVNIMTNPLVVSLPIYIQIKYGLNARFISVFILEILATIGEGIVYFKFLKYKNINRFILSLVLNLSSYWIGKIINYYLYN